MFSYVRKILMLFSRKMKFPYKLMLMIFLITVFALTQYHLIKLWPMLSAGFILSLNGAAEEETEDNLDIFTQGTVNRLMEKYPALVSCTEDVQLRQDLKSFGLDILFHGCHQVRRKSAKPFYPSIASYRPIYIITPTYRRPEQIADLLRFAQTLLHVENIFWLVIEDAITPTPLVTQLLDRIGIPYEHLIAPMPDKYKNLWGGKAPRGVSNRNRGLQWLRANAKTGVFYFADDDNTYDIRLFEEMRTTKKVAMWPVGLCTDYGISSPIVANGTFMGFYDGWEEGRKFPVDMAGFAVSVEFLLQRPAAEMPFVPGFEEDGFLKGLAPFEPNEIELKAKNCTEILVWHTQTKKNKPSPALDMTKYNNTNLVELKRILV